MCRGYDSLDPWAQSPGNHPLFDGTEQQLDIIEDRLHPGRQLFFEVSGQKTEVTAERKNRAAYQEKGFFLVEVTSELRPTPVTGEADAVFTIKENKPVEVDAIVSAFIQENQDGLPLIEDSLVKSLTAVYHGRVKYPSQQTA